MQRVCAGCGGPRGETDRFCARCGREFTDDTPGVPSNYSGAILQSNIGSGALQREPVWRATQSPWLIGLLVFATFNLYALWWLGRTWAQIKHEDGDPRKHPVWHALAVVVPIYGFFRFYAHMRAIVALGATAEARGVLNPVAMTVAWMAVNFLAGAASWLPEAPAWVSILASALGAALIGYAQSGLNIAWLSLPGGTVRARSHPLHWLLLILGVLLYAGILVSSVAPEST